MNEFIDEKLTKLMQDPCPVKCAGEQAPSVKGSHFHIEWEVKFFSDHAEIVPPRLIHGVSLCEKDGFEFAVLIDEEDLVLPGSSDVGCVRVRSGAASAVLIKIMETLSVLPEEETACAHELGRTFFRLLKRALTRDVPLKAGSDPVRDTALFLEKHYYRKDLSIEEIAEKLGYSQQYLNRKFRQYCGCSLRQELTRLRLLHARELLSCGGYLVSDAARLTGWGNAFYFSRVYRKYFGFPPSGSVPRH